MALNDSAFRFKFDDVQVSDPINWQETTQVYERDDDLRFLLLTLETSYEWRDDAYDTLLAAWEDSWCTTIEVTIEFDCNQSGAFKTIHKGKIFLSEVEFDTWACIATAKVSDNAFNSLIKENKKQKYVLNVGRSKNDTDIDAYVDASNVYFHTVTTGVQDGSPTTCYRVEDAFRFLLKAISDGVLEFESDTFGAGGDWEGLVTVTGQEIYDKDAATAPDISFEQLFEEVNKKIPIFGVIEDALTDNPTVRIEAESYFLRETSVQEYSTVRGISFRVATEKLYNILTIGSDARISDDIPSGGTNLSHPNTRWAGWEDEEYNMTGECGIDQTLDLRNDNFLIDSNSIENIRVNGGLSGGDADFDKVFLVVTELLYPGGYATEADDFLNLTLYYYNERITNANVAINWLGAIPNSIAKFLSDDQGFRAQLSAVDAPAAFPIIGASNNNIMVYDDEACSVCKDPNSNHDQVVGSATEGRYVAPNTGGYSFRVLINLINNNVILNDFSTIAVAYIRHYNSGSIFQSEQTITSLINAFGGTTMILPSSHTFYMAQNDYVRIEIDTFIAGANVSTSNAQGLGVFDPFFAGDENKDFGGIFEQYNPEEYKAINYTFTPQEATTYTQFETIYSAPRDQVTFNNYVGWPKRISHNVHTGQTDFEIVSDLINNQ